jgi:hypothetical protein
LVIGQDSIHLPNGIGHHTAKLVAADRRNRLGEVAPYAVGKSNESLDS